MAIINQMQAVLDVRANNNEKSDQFGRYYAQIRRNHTLSLRGLANHIASHGTIYTRDIVEGVLTKLCQCIPELLAVGQPVKLDGLGIFYPTAQAVKGGMADLAEVRATAPSDAVQGIHVRFLPDGTKLDDLTSKAFKEKCSLVWGNEVTITGYKTSASGKTKTPVYALTPISQPAAPDPAPEPHP